MKACVCEPVRSPAEPEQPLLVRLGGGGEEGAGRALWGEVV